MALQTNQYSFVTHIDTMAARSEFHLDTDRALLLNAFNRVVSGVPGCYDAAGIDADTNCLICQAAPNKSGQTRKLRMSASSTISTIEVPKGYHLLLRQPLQATPGEWLADLCQD